MYFLGVFIGGISFQIFAGTGTDSVLIGSSAGVYCLMTITLFFKKNTLPIALKILFSIFIIKTILLFYYYEASVEVSHLGGIITGFMISLFNYIKQNL